MFQSSEISRNVSAETCIRRRMLSGWLVARVFGCFLSLFTALCGAPLAFAQSSGCLPYSANYPCVYVANAGASNTGSSVSVLSATTNAVIGPPIAVDPTSIGVYGVAVTPSNAFAYVAIQNAIDVIDTVTNTLTADKVNLPSQPTQIAISHDGAFLWVTEQGFGYSTPMVQAIETATINPNTQPIIKTVTTPGSNLVFNDPRAIAFSLDGATAYVADSCGNYACIDVIDTASYILKKQISLFNSLTNTLPFNNASIAITPDGSLICVAVQVASSNGTPIYGVAFVRTTDQSLLSIATFPNAPASNVGLAITSDGTLYLATSDGIVLVNTSNQSYAGLLQFESGPTGIAVAPDGATLYVTNSGPLVIKGQASPTVSVIRGGLLIKTIPGIGNSPQGVAIMPSLPPTIITQPSSQTTGFGQPVTLNVTATGTRPLTYQWYEGESGDTSTPITGATSSSYTTPAQTATTSYWVAVSNLVTNALVASPLATGAPSATATIMPTLRPPTCKLTLQETSSLYTISANAICTDPQQSSLVTTLDWNDGTTTVASGGTVLANHTYLSPRTESPYEVTVTSRDELQLSGTMQLPLLLSPAQAVFAGQTATVSIMLASPSPVQVTFVCSTITDSNGHESTASDLGISCSSDPSVITLNQQTQPVTITIETTGVATALGVSSPYSRLSFSLLLPVPIFLLLGVRSRPTRSRHTSIRTYLAFFALMVILLPAVSCGGGFAQPKIQQFSTPAGNFQITVTDVPVNSRPSDFVQTTLIVPLTVSPTQ